MELHIKIITVKNKEANFGATFKGMPSTFRFMACCYFDCQSFTLLLREFLVGVSKC